MMQTETFRREMPAPLAPRPLNLPESFQTTLANGLTLVLIEDKRLPLINFRLAFRSGDANDPAELPGLSDMMAHLLTEGTTTRTSRQIAEEIERLGATVSVGSSSDFTTIAASGLSVYADEILELVADVTLRATFPQNEVDLARENTQQMLIQQRAQPTFLASERMAQVMFGTHPYSR
ncbi:MAG TPA: insulinase family protein, partial [Pyrinomonadaceae bacterium]|nr:insulinase family protein [Pyrinomonadaceae bacterium]